MNLFIRTGSFFLVHSPLGTISSYNKICKIITVCDIIMSLRLKVHIPRRNNVYARRCERIFVSKDA